MRKNHLLFLSFLFVSTFLFAQKSLLYKISGNGLQQPSYLFGTLHIICADRFFMDSTVIRAFNESSKLVLEVDMENPSVQQKLQHATVNANYRNIKEDLSSADNQLLDSCLKAEMNIGIDQIGILKPWAIMMAYSISSILDCETKKQYENELTGMAKLSNKPIGELETFDYQISIFESIPYSQQLEMLMETVKEKKKEKDDFEALVNAYLNQDVDELYNLMMQEEKMKEFADRLFYQRNINWIPIIKTMTAENSVFIAFGAGHLAGKGGVIELLKKEGFSVEPVVE